MLVLKKNNRCMELEIFIPILYTAKIMSIVKNEHLILCTLLMAKSLALEVCYIPFVVYLNIQKKHNKFCYFLKIYFSFSINILTMFFQYFNYLLSGITYSPICNK
jgi:hypothetical protein